MFHTPAHKQTTNVFGFKVPPTGTIPKLGDILNARHEYSVQVGGSWDVTVFANNLDEARFVAMRNGYTPSLIITID